MQTKMQVPHSIIKTECFLNGELQWAEEVPNMVFDDGVNFLLSQFFSGADYTATWYVGLIDSGATFAESDTMALHPGWTENSNYDAAGRPAVTFGPAASKTISNIDSRASFTINGVGGTIAGTFIATDSTKNGSAGTVYSAALFLSGDKVLAAGAVILVTVTFLGQDGG